MSEGMSVWPPGPAVSVGPEGGAAVDWRIASTAGVFTPLPGAILAALVEGTSEAAVTNLISLTFPMTLIVAGLFLLGREQGLIGWLTFLLAGTISAAVMYWVLRGTAPPATLEVLKSEEPLEQPGEAGTLGRFLVPGLLTGGTFWLVLRLAYPRVFVRQG